MKEWELCAYQLIIGVCDILDESPATRLLAAAQRRTERILPRLDTSGYGKMTVESVSKRIKRIGITLPLEGLGAKVDAQRVVLQCGGQHSTVGRQYVAAFRRDHTAGS